MLTSRSFNGLVDIVAAKNGVDKRRRLTARGLPAVNYGPGDTALAHRADSASVEDGELFAGATRSF